MTGRYREDYNQQVTRRCERALVSLIGNIGPWNERVVLVGGLAPRYIIGTLPLGAAIHVGTADVDLVIRLAVEDAAETYTTLRRNLIRSGFASGQHSYQWDCEVDGMTVTVEFLCDTNQVGAGQLHRPKQGTGSGFGALNVPGAQLATRDFIEVELEAERLDDGGLSRVSVRVAGLLAYVVLKILAFQDRHNNKDAYDLVYTLVNYPGGGPLAAAHAAANSPVRNEPQVLDALRLLGERFARVDHDGPNAYANFLARPDDTDGKARLRNTAVIAVSQVLAITKAK